MSSKFLLLPLSDMELISKTLPLLETMPLAVKYFLPRISFNKCTIKLRKHCTLHLDCFYLHQIFRNQHAMTRNTMNTEDKRVVRVIFSHAKSEQYELYATFRSQLTFCMKLP